MKNDFQARRVADGFKLSSGAVISKDEMVWIEFLRIICNDEATPPDSRMVVELRELPGLG